MNTLPGLRGLSELADLAPTIVIDSREQTPLTFSRFKATAGTLVTGDYSISGLENLFSVERKSISDLVGCCMGDSRERFERELHRLRGFTFKRLLIVGERADIEERRYHSNVEPKSVLGSVAAWEIRYDVPVVWCPSPEIAAGQIETWAWYFAREVVTAANSLLRGSREQPKEQVQKARASFAFFRAQQERVVE
jgi:ERCC4-type nuclease